MKIAVVHEWLDTYAGSERVLEEILTLYPQADVFVLVDYLSPNQRGISRWPPNYDFVHPAFAIRSQTLSLVPTANAVCNRAIRFIELRSRHIKFACGRQRNYRPTTSAAHQLRA